MIEGLRSAIARLSLPPNSGTAFLVSNDGLVLTAAHCLAYQGATPKDPRWIGGTVQLFFGDAAVPAQAQFAQRPDGTEEPLAFDVAQDWALLKCSPVPPSVTPIPLCAYDANYRDWACWGFPSTIKDGQGQFVPEAYDGNVTNWGPAGGRVQLQFNQAGPATFVSGMSGAPFVVGGEAVGMIVQSVQQAGGAAGEPVLFARLFDVAALRAQRVPVTDSVLPLQRPLMQLLQLSDALAEDIALRLLLGSIAGPARARGIARRLLTLPLSLIKGCYNVLASARPAPNVVGRLLCAARLPDDALKAARRNLIEQPLRGVTVHAAQSLTPVLHAVGACVPEYYGDLPRRVFTVSLRAGEAGDTGALLLTKLREQITAALREQLAPGASPAEVKAALNADVGDGQPFFVVVTDVVEPSALKPMQDEFDNARFIVRTERPDAHDASLPLVGPAVAAADEDAIWNAYKVMPRSLQ